PNILREYNNRPRNQNDLFLLSFIYSPFDYNKMYNYCNMNTQIRNILNNALNLKTKLCSITIGKMYDLGLINVYFCNLGDKIYDTDILNHIFYYILSNKYTLNLYNMIKNSIFNKNEEYKDVYINFYYV